MECTNLKRNSLSVLAFVFLGCAGAGTYREPPNFVKDVNRFALWCIEKGLWDEARVHLEKAVSKDSTSAALYNNLGIIYEHMGHLEDAEAAYRRAVELDPKGKLYRWNYERFRLLKRGAAKPSEERVDSIWVPEEPGLGEGR